MSRQKYLMRVCNRLLIKLRMNGIDPTEASLFFGTQANLMLDCPPNYGPNTKRSKLHGLSSDVWLMRGFYPATPQMFKISIAYNPSFSEYDYYVKVSEPTVKVPANKNARRLNFTPRYESSFESNEIKEQLSKRLENEVLGTLHSIDPIISDKVVFTPKSISPKGMAVYKLNLKKE